MADLLNLVKMTTATTGTGTITLGSAVSGFLTMAQAGAVDATTYSYGIVDGSNTEVGRGVYTASGTTFTRTVLKSTNSNNAINLSGSAVFYCTPVAEDFSAASILALLLTVDGAGSGLDADHVDGVGPVAAATYTPTYTGVANIDSVSHQRAVYFRFGSLVIVMGAASIDPTSAGVETEVGISFPVASPGLGDSFHVTGIASSRQSADTQHNILADTVNKRAFLTFVPVGTGGRFVFYSFQYLIA